MGAILAGTAPIRRRYLSKKSRRTATAHESSVAISLASHSNLARQFALRIRITSLQRGLEKTAVSLAVFSLFILAELTRSFNPGNGQFVYFSGFAKIVLE
jgi:hypothetical protein